jgi:hypothetical protein
MIGLDRFPTAPIVVRPVVRDVYMSLEMRIESWVPVRIVVGGEDQPDVGRGTRVPRRVRGERTVVAAEAGACRAQRRQDVAVSGVVAIGPGYSSAMRGRWSSFSRERSSARAPRR